MNYMNKYKMKHIKNQLKECYNMILKIDFI